MTDIEKHLRKFVATGESRHIPRVGYRMVQYILQNAKVLAAATAEEFGEEHGSSARVLSVKECARATSYCVGKMYLVRLKVMERYVTWCVPTEFAEHCSYLIFGEDHSGVLAPQPEREAATLGYLCAAVLRRVRDVAGNRTWITGVQQCDEQQIQSAAAANDVPVFVVTIKIAGSEVNTLLLLDSSSYHYAQLSARTSRQNHALSRRFAVEPLEFRVSLNTEFPAISSLLLADRDRRSCCIAGGKSAKSTTLTFTQRSDARCGVAEAARLKCSAHTSARSSGLLCAVRLI